MKLKGIYHKKDKVYAEFVDLNDGLGIEFDKTTNKVWTYILALNDYIGNEEEAYYFDINTNTLVVPIKKSNS